MPVDPVLLESLFCHEALRRLDFKADDIFLELARAGDPQTALMDTDAAIGDLFLFVVLRAQCREFSIAVGRWSDTEEALATAWGEAIAWFNGGPADGETLWRASRIARQSVKLIVGLQTKGFILPAFAASQMN